MPFGMGPYGWMGMYGYPYWGWRCRWFPWLPRWWWTGMYGPITPFMGAPGTSYTPYGQYDTYTTSAPTVAPWTAYAPYSLPPYSTYTPPTTAMPNAAYPFPYPTGAEAPQIPREQEREMLESQAAALQQQLDQIKKRLEELSKI